MLNAADMLSSIPVLTFWAPIVCLIAFAILVGVVYAYRSRGEGRYKKGTQQTEIFLSGEPVPEEVERHVRSHNMYWGFFEALQKYYGPVVRAHSGIVNDYLIWLLGLSALAGILLLAA
jgi:multicomponent Na+:H+ antiporter subunit D